MREVGTLMTSIHILEQSLTGEKDELNVGWGDGSIGKHLL